MTSGESSLLNLLLRRPSSGPPKLPLSIASKHLVNAARYDFENDPSRYSKPLSVFAELLPRTGSGGLAPVKLLRSSWFLARAAEAEACQTNAKRQALALLRRQDLERECPEAFYTAKEVARMALPPAPKLGILAHRLPQLKVLAVSHCWETPEHADPECRTLIALAKAIRAAQTQHQATALGRKQKLLPQELAIFFDWCSLYQKSPDGAPRADNERAAFQAALGRMQLWYAHQGTTAVFMSAPRKDAKANVKTLPYHGRGWPTFEYRVALLAKPGQDTTRWPSLIDVGSDGSAADTASGASSSSSFDAGAAVGDTLAMVRHAPMTPERFVGELQQKVFSNGADHEMVARLYEDTAATVISGAKKLSYHGVGWDDKDLMMFCEWLPRCTLLEALHLGANRFGDGSIARFAQVVADGAPSTPILGNLTRLFLHANDSVGEIGARWLVEALEKGALPRLQQLSYPRPTAELRGACMRRGIKLGAKGTTPKQQTNGTQIQLRADALGKVYGKNSITPTDPRQSNRLSTTSQPARMSARKPSLS